MIPGEAEDFEKAGLWLKNLSTGVWVGTVEIVGCGGNPAAYQLHLANPKRLPKPLKPVRHPQLVWCRFKRSSLEGVMNSSNL
jgi:hypothetical protein